MLLLFLRVVQEQMSFFVQDKFLCLFKHAAEQCKSAFGKDNIELALDKGESGIL